MLHHLNGEFLHKPRGLLITIVYGPENPFVFEDILVHILKLLNSFLRVCFGCDNSVNLVNVVFGNLSDIQKPILLIIALVQVGFAVDLLPPFSDIYTFRVLGIVLLLLDLDYGLSHAL